MNKKKYNRLALLAFIMSLFALSGCNGSGDETISLEYGNPKKMVVGQWILSDMTRSGGYSGDFVFSDWKPGTWLAFYDDGTYSDSSDGGKTPHRWVLSGTPDGSTPYYGGIDLDDKEFGIGNLGPGRWILEYPKGSGDGGLPGWELGLDKGDDDPGPKTFEPVAPEPEPEPEPEPVVEKRYLVKEITLTETGGYDPNKHTWSFEYDKQDRISYFGGGFPDEIWFSYSNSGDEVFVKTLSDITVDGSIVQDVGITNLVVTSYTTYPSKKYTSELKYNSDGYLVEAKCDENNYGWIKFEYSNGNLKLGDTPYSTELNDANIDLNCFIRRGGANLIESSFGMGDLLILEPFGFYGKRSVNLIKGTYDTKEMEVARDGNGNIVTIKLWDGNKKTTTLTILYEERTKEVK